ncbi:DNA-3-methyladenine glycosylase family protein [Sphingomonas sp.]|uniref:DNA-3-methyladenine glycosylase family protein n=1 Tax=Sphingomonas sp. TaxID=28214 RepID=UPI0038A56B0B
MKHDSAEAYGFLRREFPRVAALFDATGEVPLPEPNHEPVKHALVRIVIGQMLSTSAASSIKRRVGERVDALGAESAYDLSDDDLRECGISPQKTRTLRGIQSYMDQDPSFERRWRSLPFAELRREVSSLWGLSDWSASVLAIFHFGHPDVFPLTDGSLVRAIDRVQSLLLAGEPLEHDRAAPYRSYLAVTLWHALDNGHLNASVFESA